ncbi:MAG: hypothetical protein B6I26_02275 [Desulfobacteraceae bacterium 4572_130]|nr:MAG: hypothetical protein B6I26_02275 [Desulfobacteraceae bacterium 4572_130]
MFKKIIFILITYGFFFNLFSVFAQENNTYNTYRLYPCPDWVHPEMRKKYPGYKKHKQQQKQSSIWKYQTNRPLGNIRGGGTVGYYEYLPFYRTDLLYPPKKIIFKNRYQPK